MSSSSIGCAQDDGVVMLAGTPEDNVLGHDAVCRVGHVRSVVAVQDRLSYPVKEVRRTVRGQ